MASSHERITSEHLGIGEVLGRYRLAVPSNQREFSWEGEHVVDLLDDIQHAIESAASSYFLGTIVFTRGENEDVREVVDGQQRLATATIILAAIRDWFYRNDDLTRAQTIEDKFLFSRDLVTTDITPKLKLNVDDNEFFRKYILARPDDSGRDIESPRDSHKRLAEAARLASERLQRIVETLSNEQFRRERLFQWVQYIESGAQVIALRVPDHLNAFIMFETLNDRGLEISEADLVKNHVLRVAKDRINEAQLKWATMIGNLETVEAAPLTYLHHYLITKDGPTKERDVFRRISSAVNTPTQAVEFLDEAAEAAQDYCALFNPDHVKWNDYGTSARRDITLINNVLKVEQIKPLMFAVARRFSVKEADLAFRMFVFWSVRFLIVGGRGGLLDRNYSVTAQEIGIRKIKTAGELAKALAEIIPNDALFEASFSTARVSKAQLARYYLRALEQKRKGDSEPELVPSDEEKYVNLEHVLPINPSANWSIDEETAKAYYRRIGNMVILQAKRNASLGNSDFGKKKTVLEQSAFLLTAEVAREADWGPAEITRRQSRLAKLAVETWPTGLP